MKFKLEDPSTTVCEEYSDKDRCIPALRIKGGAIIVDGVITSISLGKIFYGPANIGNRIFIDEGIVHIVEEGNAYKITPISSKSNNFKMFSEEQNPVTAKIDGKIYMGKEIIFNRGEVSVTPLQTSNEIQEAGTSNSFS